MLGAQPTIQAYALTGTRTSNLLVHRPALNRRGSYTLLLFNTFIYRRGKLYPDRLRALALRLAAKLEQEYGYPN